jgi:hypothetical protein
MKTRSIRRQAHALHPASLESLADLIGDLKKSVSQRLAREFRDCVPLVVMHRAIDDAAEVASSTEFPHLFFPALAEEKVRLVSAALCEEHAHADDLLHSAA